MAVSFEQILTTPTSSLFHDQIQTKTSVGDLLWIPDASSFDMPDVDPPKLTLSQGPEEAPVEPVVLSPAVGPVRQHRPPGSCASPP